MGAGLKPVAPLDTVTATFRVVMPMFLGDARQQASRFSLASFKGALRFWWRALVWADCYKRAGGDQNQALRILAEREKLLFGAAAELGQEGLGQAHVLMRLVDAALGRPLAAGSELKDGDGRRVGPGARYLGYGLMAAFGGRAGQLDRPCFPAGGKFKVKIAFRAPVRCGFKEDKARRKACDAFERDRQTVVQAVQLLGLLGGLGARSRRGWGSLTLERLSEREAAFAPPGDADGYVAALGSLVRTLPALPAASPPFSALTEMSRIEVVHQGGDPLKVLDHVGRQMQRYRAWGFKGEVNGRPSERNFARDHDWSKSPWQREFAGYVPQRAAFGLPHNYGKGPSVKPAADEAGDRRASPLLIHIHALGNGSHVAVLTMLPARFLPDDEVMLTWPNQRSPTKARMPKDWPTILHGFFDGPPDAQRRGLDPYFPAAHRKQILP